VFAIDPNADRVEGDACHPDLESIPGSVPDAAAEYGRGHGVKVIDGGCPLMFPPTSDTGHRIMQGMCSASGNLPRRVQ
jgi:uncharacterized protein